jgi:acetyl-CoA C-acetyltransferase
MLTGVFKERQRRHQGGPPVAGSVILAGARTPIGKLSGSLASLSGTDLGGIAIEAALRRAGVPGDGVDYVVMGQVILAGAGGMPSRQAAAKGGVPMTVPSTTINKACLSGLNAIHLADQMIRSGEADIVVAGGMESMTNAPYLLANGRSGYRYGDGTLHDAILRDALLCAFEDEQMGAGTERYAAAEGMPRAPQDEFAAASHERAARAQKDGLFDDEITPVSIPQRKGEPLVVSVDEGIRVGTTAEALAKLPAAFAPGGNVTAGNASQLSDGAAAVVVASQAAAERLDATPLAEIVGYGQVAGPDTNLLHQPSRAIQQALARADLAVSDVDLFEINEAFAAVGLASMADLGITADVCNVNGGAIALGHPVGMSGARLALTIALEMRRRGGGLAAAGLCGAAGQGDAILLRVG